MKILFTAVLMLSIFTCLAQKESDFKVFNRNLTINKAGNGTVIY